MVDWLGVAPESGTTRGSRIARLDAIRSDYVLKVGLGVDFSDVFYLFLSAKGE